MKIFNFFLDIEPGKYKYQNQCFDKLVDKFSPDKQSPYIVEFMNDDIEKAEAVVFDNAKKVDFVFIDLEKIEKRLIKAADSKERDLLCRAQKMLEEENLLCDCDFPEEEKAVLKELQLATYKPAVGIDKSDTFDMKELISKVINKAEILLFFTAGKKDVHAWSVKRGMTILEAAGKIHSDLKRGFIRADIVNGRDLDSFYNMAEAKSRGFTKVVDKTYIMQDDDIIDVKFSV